MNKRRTIIKVSLLAALVVGVFNNVKAWALEESWGPQDRELYTVEVPATEPVFNSITNNPELGNETNFVRVREYISDTATNTYTDEVDLEVGKEYEVYVYYHNNAHKDSPLSTGVAQNVRLKMEIPEKVSKNQTAVVKGTITWNKSGNTVDLFNVWDTAFLNANDTIYLRYVPGTLKIHNSGTEKGGQPVPESRGGSTNGMALDADAMFGEDGVKLAHYAAENLWGVIPACNEYAGYVTFRLKVDQPKFFIEKEVLDGENWVDTIEAEPGDTLHFRIRYYNTGTVLQEGVNMSDNLPSELLFEKDKNATDATKNYKIKAVRIIKNGDDVTNEVMVDGDKFFGEEGLVMGNFDAGLEVDVYYDVKVADAASFKECSTDIWNKAQVATENGTEFDKVKITVKKDCTPPKKDCKTNPEMEECQEIPETGPVEIAIVSMIVFGISFGCFYLWRSNRALKKLQANVLEDNQSQDSTNGQEPKNEQ